MADSSPAGLLATQSPWLERVKNLLGPRGYDPSMRRSVQTLVIYEAKRCIQPRIGDLRPFQRKVALVDQAQALVNTLDFCLPHHKAEILWRTSTSRETVTPEICWKRFQLVQKELDRLSEMIKQFMAPERSHQETVDELEQHLFETSGDNQGKPNQGKLVPPNWAYAHNHVILAFRLYYKGSELDPEFPDPVPPKNIVVPAVMPTKERRGSNNDKDDGDTDMITTAGIGRKSQGGAAAPAYTFIQPPNPAEERRKLLQEVKDHLALLKEFEDIAGEEEILKRRRDLFAALPPIPPPYNSNKRARLG
mmetsp:Transcript_10882/g.30107  ORF Transcript_10882/g.30107 Transcript_10882/m.30107 type:complete len:306 (-) Transcript_10882:1733-2650(-)